MGAIVGIRPKATGETIILTDTHRELVDDATATTDEFGTALGEGINEIAATAQSANSGARELAERVKKLEGAVSGPRVIPWSGVGTMPSIPAGCRLLNQKTGELWAP